MAEYIEREVYAAELAKGTIISDDLYGIGIMSGLDYAMKKLKEQPAADVAPVVHAVWHHLGGDEWCCTSCGEVMHTEGSWEKPDKKFCYECGARMDGK